MVRSRPGFSSHHKSGSSQPSLTRPTHSAHVQTVTHMVFGSTSYKISKKVTCPARHSVLIWNVGSWQQPSLLDHFLLSHYAIFSTTWYSRATCTVLYQNTPICHHISVKKITMRSLSFKDFPSLHQSNFTNPLEILQKPPILCINSYCSPCKV